MLAAFVAKFAWAFVRNLHQAQAKTTMKMEENETKCRKKSSKVQIQSKFLLLSVVWESKSDNLVNIAENSVTKMILLHENPSCTNKQLIQFINNIELINKADRNF